MAHEITSKNIDGITDLVVVAPIKEGFIEAYENITFATRLKLVAEALNRVRVTAREHERITPFSDVTERILTLLDFRVGVIDKDVFSLRVADADAGKGLGEERTMEMKSRRYLYLTATFDGAWEPYMRLIWDPLGPFLDLLFCNCEGYVTAADHSFAEYAQWVRDNQMDSAIFYATTGLTIRDHMYLAQVERTQRAPVRLANLENLAAKELALAETVMTYPEDKATATRAEHSAKTVELGLEALTVLYKLADYYPPQWLTGTSEGLGGLNEGQRLAQVARDLLKGFDNVIAGLDHLAQTEPPPGPFADAKTRWVLARKIYAEPLRWYETGRAELKRLEANRIAAQPSDPDFVRSEVQGGILEKQGAPGQPIRQGALLLFTIGNAAATRAFLKTLRVHYAAENGTVGDDGVYCNIGFTPDGLRRLGVNRATVERFPAEFRQGMAARSGLVGDMRENHPRNWILPERNGPALLDLVPTGTRLPPVETSEIDFVVQVRSTNSDIAAMRVVVKEIAEDAKVGASLEAVEWLESGEDPQTGMTRDAFGFADGVSQPQPASPESDQPSARDKVALGEIVIGYRNDRHDAPPGEFTDADKGDNAWRRGFRQAATNLQKNGSFLVLRKIGQDIDEFERWLVTGSTAINVAHPELATPMIPERLKALVLGRKPDGDALVPVGAQGRNDFDYTEDGKGHSCPFASHVRRANPRKTHSGADVPPAARMEFDRPTPRILRRGMRLSPSDPVATNRRGLMFMAYNASIAEQYEVIQRWLNGGNSTDVASAQNDPLTGVQPKGGPGVFRFVEQGTKGPVAVSVELPSVLPAPLPGGASEPGRHPFAPLYWGLYLFVPSRSSLAELTELTGEYSIMEEPLELYVGQPILDRLRALGETESAKEWKRLLEDFDAKDPAQRDLSPSLWGTIRWKLGGAYNLGQPLPLIGYDWQHGPDREHQNVILVAGRSQVRRVLADWKNLTVEEQLRRIEPNSGPIFVTQQPDNVYRNDHLNAAGLDYPAEAKPTNEILLGYDEKAGFQAGYAAGLEVLSKAKTASTIAQRTSFKLELRRQYLLPALGGLCRLWYGLPDESMPGEGHMLARGWTWEEFVESAADVRTDASGNVLTRTKAHCPGDFLSPSRNAFYPRPGPAVTSFADNHGKAILDAATKFVATHRPTGGPPNAPVARAMFAATPDPDHGVLARNLIGTMVGAIPPMDGNLRGILLEWLGEKSLWRHQAALRAAMAGRSAISDFDKARAVLYRPIAQAMCKRPAPDLLYRTATGETTIPVYPNPPQGPTEITTQEGDLVVVSLVSASQRSLLKLREGDDGEGDVSIVFGGRRETADQGYRLEPGQDGQESRAVPDPAGSDHFPVHACPAQDMAMGAIMGIMAALLDAGTIQALPASLIVKISDWA